MYLFLICVEILVIKIWKRKDVNGIYFIYGKKNLVFVGDILLILDGSEKYL